MKAFFDEIRPMFERGMTQGCVDGLNTLLKATENLAPTQRAYLLATAFHETAQTMQPIHERGGRPYFDRYEPNTRAGRNLGNTRPGDGYLFRGRGYVQLTGRRNYLLASEKTGTDLVADPDMALRPAIAAHILVQGCLEGWFTGHRLDEYLPDYTAARRVVNGTDRAVEIAHYAADFERALMLPMPQEIEQSPRASFWSWLFGLLKGRLK